MTAAEEITEVEAVTRRLKQLKLEIQEREEERELLWRRFDQLGEDASPGESYKHTSVAEAWTAHKIMAYPSPRIDFNSLQPLLTHEQWLEATRQERVPDQERLEDAVRRGVIESKTVALATTQPPAQTRHKDDNASTKDLAEARGAVA